MQYWINHNGVQSGPVDVDGIKEMGLTSAAYVWHEGLTDWVKITQLPELQGMYEMLEPVAEPAVTGQPLETQPAATQPAPAQQPQINYQQPATTEPCPPTATNTARETSRAPSVPARRVPGGASPRSSWVSLPCR